MAELTAEEVEAVAEALPVFIEGMTKAKLAFISLGSAAAGAGAAFVALNRVLRTKYEAIAEEEISQMREHFHAKVVALEGKPALDDLVTDLGYVPSTRSEMQDGTTLEPQTAPVADPGAPNVTIETDSEIRNVFTDSEEVAARIEIKDAEEGWDYDTERSQRVAGKPYVIHRDEQEEMGLTQSTFTYYEGDDVLCDERDRVVDSRDEILGSDFMEKFGHGSDDPNVVYIRNEELGVEIEVCRSPNSYAEEVHGFKHSDEVSFRPTRRVTFDDE
jgi:hypothetical protein